MSGLVEVAPSCCRGTRSARRRAPAPAARRTPYAGGAADSAVPPSRSCRLGSVTGATTGWRCRP